MEDIQKQISDQLSKIVYSFYNVDNSQINLSLSDDFSHGDFTSNIALMLAKQVGKSPREVAEEIKNEFIIHHSSFIDKVEVAGPGFINFWVSSNVLSRSLETLFENPEKVVQKTKSEKKIMVEYAHPNTHKEMHIGHMRTLITGESIARLLEAVGAKVFRANYQGDIGPHVAKALYGVQKMVQEENLMLVDIETWSNKDKAHFLGKAYARGSADYEQARSEIDAINQGLYQHDPSLEDLYQTTRRWSLDYYADFYKRFYTKFDQLFFESNMVEDAKKIVEENTPKIFTKDNGAIVFPGDKYGLHTRVFITQAGNPTYEGKEMALAFIQYETFPFDKSIHVVANEQAGYFQVVIKALEMIDSYKFKNKEFHLSMGMVQLADKKMSSRTGDVLTVDWLLDQVKAQVEELMTGEKLNINEKLVVTEQIVIGAVKHSVLKAGTGQDVAFDIQKSISLEGDSGPYLQYTFVRTQSVLSKSESRNSKGEIADLFTQSENFLTKLSILEQEETQLLRLLFQYQFVVQLSADNFAPNSLAKYLFELAKMYNLFYQKHPILKAKDSQKQFRLALTQATGNVLKQGLYLLGIEAPEKM